MDERKAWVIGVAVVIVAIVAFVTMIAYFSPPYTTCVN